MKLKALYQIARRSIYYDPCQPHTLHFYLVSDIRRFECGSGVGLEVHMTNYATLYQTKL